MRKMVKKIAAIMLCSALCLSGTGVVSFAEENDGRVNSDKERYPNLDYITTESGKEISVPKNNYEGNKYGWYEADNVIYIFDNDTKEIQSVKCRYNHLEEFTIPDNFKSISGQLYGLDSTEVDKIYIPKTVEEIDIVGLVYLNCGEYIVDEDNPVFCSIDGAVYTKDGKALVAFPTARKSNIYVMPEGVTSMWSLLLPTVLSHSKNLEYFIFASTYNLPENEITEVNYAINSSESKLKAVYYEGMPNRDEGKLANAKEALKMAIGIEEKQLNLQEYVKNGAERYLYDFDNNGNVDLKDAKIALSRALGIIE